MDDKSEKDDKRESENSEDKMGLLVRKFKRFMKKKGNKRILTFPPPK